MLPTKNIFPVIAEFGVVSSSLCAMSQKAAGFRQLSVVEHECGSMHDPVCHGSRRNAYGDAVAKREHRPPITLISQINWRNWRNWRPVHRSEVLIPLSHS